MHGRLADWAEWTLDRLAGWQIDRLSPKKKSRYPMTRPMKIGPVFMGRGMGRIINYPLLRVPGSEQPYFLTELVFDRPITDRLICFHTPTSRLVLLSRLVGSIL